jgi:two-component system sensor histidine kinase AlgZ
MQRTVTPPDSSSLGSVFDRLGDLPPPPRTPASPFDVCHVGLVLRAVVGVQGVAALGTALAAGAPAAWVRLYPQAGGIALAGTLIWLVSACALQRRLARASDPIQTLTAAALGALGAFAGWLLFGLAADLDASWWPALPTAVAGAALGAVTVHWLRLRNRSALPADTSARLAELQSRIRPHFLFNTLNTAMALVRVDPRRAEDLLADLAELFRVALDAGYDAVTLADEIELARRYLEIEQMRFGARLQVQWDLDAQADGVRVPALLLQPLLENAVRHGVEPAPDGGTIRVRTRVRRGVAVVGIDNSVSGLPSQPGRGIALRNVRERLRLMHDVAAQFDARRDGDAFRVQIVLPLPT